MRRMRPIQISDAEDQQQLSISACTTEQREARPQTAVESQAMDQNHFSIGTLRFSSFTVGESGSPSGSSSRPHPSYPSLPRFI